MPGKKKKTISGRKKKTIPGKKPASAKNKAAPAGKRPQGKPPKAGDRSEDLKRMLLRKRESVIQNTKEEVSKYISGESRQLVESALDGGDWSVIDLSEDLRLQKLGANSDTIVKIDESIRKLEEGTYGLCEDCGDEIRAERLKILPFAIRCRDCQEDHEELLAVEKGESIIF
jgi:DnaK suppressor protein